MAARFWVGGTGNWDAADTTHWAATSGGAGGETVPTSSDTVTFDSNSGAGATVTITGATANASSITINKSDLILLHNAGSTVTGTVTLTTGTLNTNGQTCSWAGFSSSNSNARSLTLGSSTITISGTGTPWNLDGSNLTLSTGTATVTLTGTDAAMAPCPNSSSWAIGSSIIFTGSGDHQIFVDGGTLGNLTFTGTATKTDKIKFAGAKTIAGTFTINGNSAINRVLVYSSTLGTARTITAATVTVTNADFQDITGAGAGSWDLSAITGGSGDCGGNSGITFTTATTQTWSGTSGGNWSANAWTTRVPLPQDTASFAVAFSASQTVSADMPRLGKDIDWTGVSGGVTFTPTASNPIVYGSWTQASGMVNGALQGMHFYGRGSHTITSAGINFSTIAIVILAFGGTYSLNDAFSTANTFTVTNGTFITNGFSLTCTTFSSSNSNIRAITLGTSTVNLTGTASGSLWTILTATNLTFSGASSTINITSASANTRNFSTGGGNTYGTLDYTVAGSTGILDMIGSSVFARLNFSDATNARTLRFTAGQNFVFTSAGGFNVNGTSGKLMTVTSVTSATHTITCASGTISSDYLNVSYSIATGGARFFAGANSTDSLNNTGWYFAAPSNGLGGTVSTSGAYTIHTFNSSGTFTATKSFNVDYLVVAGGGGGGGPSGRGGGGGAGGFRTSTGHAVTAQAYSITVGAGGAGSSASGAVGTSGGDSVFDTITSTGGGGGGTGPAGASRNGATGGSGGGAGDYSGSGTAGTGTVGQGSDGGIGMEAAPSYGAGGGGGASAVGQAGSSTKGGDGGAGTSSSISGSAVTYAGGGGGAAADAGATYGVGGTGGGGRGASNGAAVAGTANTGGGGGGGNDSGPNNGAAGGSGIVIIRYLNEIIGGNLTAYSEQEALNQLNSTGEHQYTLQEIANSYNGTAQHSLSFQEVLNTQASRGQHTMSEQEALFTNLQSALSLTGNATDYSVQELLNLAVLNSISIDTVLG